MRTNLLAAAVLAVCAAGVRAQEASWSQSLKHVEELVVDPLTGKAYHRADLVAPRPKPAEFTVDERGVKHYHYDSAREAAIKELTGRIRGDYRFVSSRTELERVMRAMFAQAPEGLLQRMAMSDVEFVIVPAGTTIPETEQGSRMAFGRAPDGRTAEETRGMVSKKRRFGGWVVFIPESNLQERLGDAVGRDGMPRETVVHEIAHAVHVVGTDDPFGDRWGSDRDIVVDQDYAQARSDKNFTDPYARTNSGEYFAQASVAWFGLHRDGRDAAWIKDHQPDLYRTLERIYGPARVIAPVR